MDLTLHGKIGNIPASEVVVVVDKKAPTHSHSWPGQRGVVLRAESQYLDGNQHRAGVKRVSDRR